MVVAKVGGDSKIQKAKAKVRDQQAGVSTAEETILPAIVPQKAKAKANKTQMPMPCFPSHNHTVRIKRTTEEKVDHQLLRQLVQHLDGIRSHGHHS